MSRRTEDRELAQRLGSMIAGAERPERQTGPQPGDMRDGRPRRLSVALQHVGLPPAVASIADAPVSEEPVVDAIFAGGAARLLHRRRTLGMSPAEKRAADAELEQAQARAVAAATEEAREAALPERLRFEETPEMKALLADEITDDEYEELTAAPPPPPPPVDEDLAEDLDDDEWNEWEDDGYDAA